MSINTTGNIAPQAAYNYQQPQSSANQPKEADNKELTTVTTHCNKKHAHDKSCPHTVSTRPAPKLGAPGYFVDKTV